MPFFLHQVGYTSEAIARLIANPQDRFEAVRGPIEKLGGKIKDSYFAFGEHDAIVITECFVRVQARRRAGRRRCRAPLIENVPETAALLSSAASPSGSNLLRV